MEDFHLDFICVGFNKCGTSSLHNVLKCIPAIQLPLNKKETCFFAWYNHYSDPVEKFRERYFPYSVGENTVRGCIEPSFIKRAELVQKYFGQDIKLIFMLRNPVQASWSMFKMRMRRVRDARYIDLYPRNKEKTDFHDMFQKYIDLFIVTKKESDFFYDIWIEKYMDYYKRDQIKFIVFEKFIQNYEEQMHDLGSFLNISVTDLPALPASNKGDIISKNRVCAKINHMIYKCGMKLRRRGTNNEIFWNNKVAPLILKHTLMEFSEKVSDENRKILEDVYRDSVRRTSEITGYPLEEYWFKNKN